MKKYSLNHFTSSDRKAQNLKSQLRVIANSSKRKSSKRERNPIELQLLIKAMMKDVERWEREGKIIKNGRKWKITF